MADLQETYDDCRRSLVHALRLGRHGLDAMALEVDRQVDAAGDAAGDDAAGGDAAGDGGPGRAPIGEGRVLPGRFLQEQEVNKAENQSRGAQEGWERQDGRKEKGREEKEDPLMMEMKGRKKRQRVFLAADMSPASVMSASMDYTMGEGSKKVAAGAMRELLRELDVVTWPTYEPWFEKVDRGVKGILDKLVAMKAGFFLGAPVDCGGGHTYTEEIHRWRAENRLPSDTWTIVRE